MLLSAGAALTVAALVAGCGGSGSGRVSLARLAENQDAYLGKTISASGIVERQSNPNGSRYYVLADASQDLVILVPNQTASRYAGEHVSVTGRFEMDPHAGRLIHIERIEPGA